MAHKEKFANIGTSPQDIPLNQMLGRQAFQDVPSGIVQVVQYNRTNQVESSYASDTTLMKVTITPKYSGSFFWVIGACGGCGTRDTSTLYEMKLCEIFFLNVTCKNQSRGGQAESPFDPRPQRQGSCPATGGAESLA